MTDEPEDLAAFAAPQEGDLYAKVLLPSGMFGAAVGMCLRCGALVGNRLLHDAHHFGKDET